MQVPIDIAYTMNIWEDRGRNDLNYYSYFSLLWEILSHPRVCSMSFGSCVLCNLSETQEFIKLARVSNISANLCSLFRVQDLSYISGVLAG